MVPLGIKKNNMSKSSNNVVTHGLSGMVGGMLVFKQVNGKTIVAQRPRKSSKAPSTDQLERQQKFKEASLFAKSIIQDPLYKPLYESLAGNGKSSYNIAFADYFKSPVLSGANLSGYTGEIGQTITVQAIDDVKVQEVNVIVKKADGTVLESGEATLLPNGLDWKYECTVANAELSGTLVSFTARDVPGNVTVLETAVP